jgi:diguanylate cyclase
MTRINLGFVTSAAASPEAWLMGLVILSFVGMSLLAWFNRPAKPTRAASPRPAAATETGEFASKALQLDREAAAILELVQSYIEAGEKYSVCLAEAGKSLPKIATPEEVGIIVKFLIAENAKMQCEAGDLRTRLEQSQSQIEELCSDLAEAQEMGMKDPLTSLSNRRGFDAILGKEIAEARERAAALCLVMVDLDNFKKINDDFGHLVGDEILKLFAAILRDNVGSSDGVARYGGEEFAIVLPATDLDDALGVTERVRRELEAKDLVMNGSGRQIGKITASFGIAQLRDGDEAQALIERADGKLYEAKCGGRNRVAAEAVAA